MKKEVTNRKNMFFVLFNLCMHLHLFSLDFYFYLKIHGYLTCNSSYAKLGELRVMLIILNLLQ